MPDETNPSKPADRPTLKVEDKRHWARKAEGDAEEKGGESGEVPSLHPTLVDEYRLRAEAAEKKLLEYIAAFKEAQADHEGFRERLNRDVERKVELKFGNLVTDLLETLDDLDLALGHATGVAEAEPLTRGVSLARDRFLATLERHGVTRLALDGEEFDPNLAEAVQLVEAEAAEMAGKVAATLRPGYAIGERVIRPARVAVARRRPAG